MILWQSPSRPVIFRLVVNGLSPLPTPSYMQHTLPQQHAGFSNDQTTTVLAQASRARGSLYGEKSASPHSTCGGPAPLTHCAGTPDEVIPVETWLITNVT